MMDYFGLAQHPCCALTFMLHTFAFYLKQCIKWSKFAVIGIFIKPSDHLMKPQRITDIHNSLEWPLINLTRTCY